MQFSLRSSLPDMSRYWLQSSNFLRICLRSTCEQQLPRHSTESNTSTLTRQNANTILFIIIYCIFFSLNFNAFFFCFPNNYYYFKLYSDLVLINIILINYIIIFYFLQYITELYNNAAKKTKINPQQQNTNTKKKTKE